MNAQQIRRQHLCRERSRGVTCTGPAFGRVRQRETGQSLVEFVVVAGLVLVPLLLMGVYVGKWAYLQDRSIEAARYAAWERVVSRSAPPQDRSWSALKSDADLQNEVAIRFFGSRNERLTAVTGSASAVQTAGGSSREPLLHKHDGQPLLVEREKNIQVATEDRSFRGGWVTGAMNAFGNIPGNPLHMTGPTVATISVTAAGIPQRLFAEVGLQNPLKFTAQAAVLMDPWSANGPGEEESLLRNGFMRPQETLAKTKAGFWGAGWALYVAGLPLDVFNGGLFSEFMKFHNDSDRIRVKIDPEQQFGDRLQPKPQIPVYQGP
ncbi:hypothetical protein ACJU26_01825 [Acidithiobacillus sp. M4-SHS-6]|uniref:hypothetical protein n=1 Tax=Acidithiobacillus sp. M4-SHS-6 TaxID=3383024 RepID=UPI0039BEAC5A